MKISFVRIENDKLPEPYKGLTTNILYLTESGHVYPEGSAKPIDIFDPSIISKLSDNPRTIIAVKPKIEFTDDVDAGLVIDYIRKYINLLSHIKISNRTSIKNIATLQGWDKEYTKEIIEALIKLGILSRYSSYIVLGDKLKEIINFELENNNG